MPTLQVLSDFHLEHRHGTINYMDFIKPSADVLALVGDIGSIYDPKLEDFLCWCSKHWKHVLYVYGNHEMYSETGDTFYEIRSILQYVCQRFPNVHFLDNKTFICDDVMFIGSALWSHIPPEKEDFIVNYLNDFQLIYSAENKLINPAFIRNEFAKNVAFIEQNIKLAMSLNKKIVVLTHHAPSFEETSPPCYASTDSIYGFASKLTNTCDYPIRLWCCGHTHYNFHHCKEGYELISNQIGYKNPTKGYKKDLSIMI